MTNTDTAWIAALRPGDEVVIDHGRYGAHNYEVHKVDKVTPSGRIVIGDRTFNPNGWERGGHQYHMLVIQEATPELRQRVIELKERAAILATIRRVNWHALPTAQLRAIAAILEQE